MVTAHNMTTGFVFTETTISNDTYTYVPNSSWWFYDTLSYRPKVVLDPRKAHVARVLAWIAQFELVWDECSLVVHDQLRRLLVIISYLARSKISCESRWKLKRWKQLN
jgi:hypothetical protein